MNYIPDALPPLTIDLGIDAYGVESTFVQNNRPATAEIAARAFELCKLAIDRQSTRIENAYPAHIGGADQLLILRSLARQRGVDLQFPQARDL